MHLLYFWTTPFSLSAICFSISYILSCWPLGQYYHDLVYVFIKLYISFLLLLFFSFLLFLLIHVTLTLGMTPSHLLYLPCNQLVFGERKEGNVFCSFRKDRVYYYYYFGNDEMTILFSYITKMLLNLVL